MVAVVSGEGLGLFGAALSGAGAGLSQAGVGQGGERVYVNAATGNLVLQRRDELLLGAGRDASLIRTYNSQGRFTDDNGDNFYFSFNQRLEFNGGNLNKAGSVITRIAGDGSRTDYRYDESRGLYVSSVGEGAHDTLEFRGGTGADAFLWTEGESGAQEVYSWQGKLSALAHRDEPGRVTISRSAAATTLTTASGEKLEIQYDGSGRAVLVKTVGADGAQRNQTYYGYDAQGRLTTVTVDLTPADNSIGDGRTFVTRYSYDGDSKRVAKMQASDGVSVSFQYQNIGGEYRVTRVTQGDGADAIVTAYAYDLAQRTATVTRVLDPATLSGLQTVLRYDERARLVELRLPQQDGAQSVRRYAYDADDNLIQSTDADGHSETYRYDAMGNLLTHTDRLGRATDYTYNAQNQTLTETTDGATQRYVYDSEHRLRYRVDAQGGVTEFRYNNQGQLTATQGYLARYDLSGLAHDQALTEGSLKTWTGAARAQGTTLTEYVYDFRGQLSRQTRYSKTDATGAGIGAATTHFIYDAEGRLLKQVNPDQAALTENASAAPESLGHRTGETLYVYDGLGRLLSVKDALGAVTTQTEYQGATILSRDAAGLQSVKTYNSAGALIDVVERDAGGVLLGKAQQYYDAQGRVIRRVDAQGAQTHYVYDGQDRVRFEIDTLGYVTENRYDALGRVTQSRRYETAYRGADVSLAALETFAGGQSAITTRRFYDAEGQVRFEIDAQGYVTGYEYDGQGRVAKKTRYDKAADLNAANLASLAAHAPSWRGDGVVQIDAGRIIKSAATGLSGGRAVANEALQQGRGALEFTVAALPTGASLGAVGFNKNPETVLTGNDYLNEVDLGVFIRDPDGAGSQGHSLMIQVNGVRTEPPSATPIKVGDRLRIEMWGADARILLQRSGQHGFTLIQTLTGVVDANANYTAQTNLYGAGAAIEAVALSGDADYHSAGVATRYVYDAKGQARFEVDAQGYVTENRYDALDRVTEKLSYSHAYAGGVFTESALQTFANGATPASHSRLVYDARGQVRFEVDALGYITEFEYDAQGRVVNKSRYAHPVDAASADLASRLPQLLNWGTDAAVSQQGGRLTRTGPASLTAGRAIAGSGLTGGEGVLEFTVDQLVNGQSLGVVGFNLNPEERLSGNDYFKEIDLGVFIRDRDGAAAEKHSVLIQYKGTQIAPATMQFVEAGDRFRIELKDGDARILLQRKGQDNYVLIHTLKDAVDATQTYVAQANLYAQGSAIGDVWMSGTATQNSERSRERVIYDAKGQARFTIDALGQVTESRYDALGRITEKLNYSHAYTGAAFTESALQSFVSGKTPAAHSRLVYDVKGQVRFTVDALGQVTETRYDSLGRVIETLSYDGAYTASTVTENDLQSFVSGKTILSKSRVIYDARGQARFTLDALGYVTENRYDAQGRVTEKRSFNAAYAGADFSESALQSFVSGKTPTTHSRLVYDVKGQARFTVDALGQVTESRYDALGRVTEKLNYSSAYTGAAFTESALQTFISGQTSASHSRLVYDAKSQVRFTIDALGQVTENRYDALGRVTEKLSYSHAYTGGVFTESALQTFANGETPASHSRLVYDAKSQVRFTIDALGQVTETRYDALGRAVETRIYDGAYTGGSASESGLQSFVSGKPSHTQSRVVYDAKGQARFTIDALGYVTENRYDALGQVAEKLSYDRAYAGPDYSEAALTQFASAQSQPRSGRLVYDAKGQARFEIDALGHVTEREYDAAGRVIATYQYNGALPADVAYTEAGVEQWLPQAAEWSKRTGPLVGGSSRIEQLDVPEARDFTGSVRSRQSIRGEGYVEFSLPSEGVNAVFCGLSEKDGGTTYEDLNFAFYRKQGGVVRCYEDSTKVKELGVLPGDTRYRIELKNGKVNYYIKRETDAGFTLVYTSAKVADSSKAYAIDSSFYKGGSLLKDVVIGTRLDAPAGRVNVSRTAYDARGLARFSLNALGQVTETRYDAAGRATQTLRYETAYSGADYSEAALAQFVAGETRAQHAYMVYDSLGQARFKLDHQGHITELEYDHNGQVTRTLSYVAAYDLSQPLTAAALETYVQGHASAGDRVEQVFYDARGLEIYRIDAGGRLIEQEYDHAGRLTHRVRYAASLNLGTAATLTQVTQAADAHRSAAANQHSRRVYDALGRLRYSLDGENYVSETLYNGQGQVTEERRYAAPWTQAATLSALSGLHPDAETRITRYAYDDAGRKISQSQRLMTGGAETWITESYAYDAHGNRTAVTDARGNVTTFAYDADNRLIAKLTPKDSVDDADISASARKGAVTRYQYDGFDNLIQESQYITEVSIHERTAADYATANVPANNDPVSGDRHTRYEYDALNRQERIRTPELNGVSTLTRKEYDRYGNVTALIEAEGSALERTTRYEFDDLNRVVKETKAFGTANASSTGYVYDAFGQVERVIDPRAYALVESNDAWAQEMRALIRSVASGGSVNRAEAMALQIPAHLKTQLYSLPDKAENLNSFHKQALYELYSRQQRFDTLGRKISETDANGQVKSTTYDAFGNIAKVIDGVGKTGYFYYDSLNRLRYSVDPAGYVIENQYTSTGKVKSKIEHYAPITLSGLNESTALSVIAGRISSVNTGAVNPNAHIYQVGGRTDYVFDTLDRVSDIVYRHTQLDGAVKNYVERFEYDKAGNRIRMVDKLQNYQQGQGVVETQAYRYVYDAANRLIKEVTPAVRVYRANDDRSVTLLANAGVETRYQYDALGNKVKVTQAANIAEQSRTTEYRYDKLNREILRIDQAMDGIYDAAANATYNNVSLHTRTEYDQMGQVVATTRQAHQNGTTPVGAARVERYGYNALSQQIWAVNADFGLSAMTYDAAGNRIQVRQYGERLTLGYGATEVSALMNKDSDDYRELNTYYDRENRVIATRTRDEQLFDLNAVIHGGGEDTERTGYYVGAQTTQSYYDGNGQVVKSVDANYQPTYYFYDDRGNRILQVDPLGVAIAWEYDYRGSVTKETQFAVPLKGTTLQALAADQSSRSAPTLIAEAKTDPAPSSDPDKPAPRNADNRVTEFRYDNLGRKVQEIKKGVAYSAIDKSSGALSHTSGDLVTAYTYDGMGNVVKVVRPGVNHVTEFTYDNLGRQETQTGETFTDFEGDTVRRRQSQSYNAFGEQVSISATAVRADGGAFSSSREGVSADRKTKQTRTEIHVLDRLGRTITSLDADNRRIQYNYDSYGNVTRQQTLVGGYSSGSTHNRTLDVFFIYDAQDQEIKRWEVDPTYLSETVSSEVRYNSYGEIEAKGKAGQWQEQFVYDHIGRVLKTNKDNGAWKLYLYDANGKATMEMLTIDSFELDGKTVTLKDIKSAADAAKLSPKDVQIRVSVYDAKGQLTDVVEPPMTFEGLSGEIRWKGAEGVQGQPGYDSGTAPTLGPWVGAGEPSLGLAPVDTKTIAAGMPVRDTVWININDPETDSIAKIQQKYGTGEKTTVGTVPGFDPNDDSVATQEIQLAKIDVNLRENSAALNISLLDSEVKSWKLTYLSLDEHIVDSGVREGASSEQLELLGLKAARYGYRLELRDDKGGVLGELVGDRLATEQDKTPSAWVLPVENQTATVTMTAKKVVKTIVDKYVDSNNYANTKTTVQTEYVLKAETRISDRWVEYDNNGAVATEKWVTSARSIESHKFQEKVDLEQTRRLHSESSSIYASRRTNESQLPVGEVLYSPSSSIKIKQTGNGMWSESEYEITVPEIRALQGEILVLRIANGYNGAVDLEVTPGRTTRIRDLPMLPPKYMSLYRGNELIINREVEFQVNGGFELNSILNVPPLISFSNFGADARSLNGEFFVAGQQFHPRLSTFNSNKIVWNLEEIYDRPLHVDAWVTNASGEHLSQLKLSRDSIASNLVVLREFDYIHGGGSLWEETWKGHSESAQGTQTTAPWSGNTLQNSYLRSLAYHYVKSAGATTQDEGFNATYGSVEGNIIRRQNRYNAFGDVVAEVDGRRTKEKYDSKGDLVYDEHGQPVQVAVSGNVTRYEYNQLGKLVREVKPETDINPEKSDAVRARPITSYYYNELGEQVAVRDARSHYTGDVYYKKQVVENGQVVKSYDRTGATKSFAYDIYGAKRTEVTELGQRIQYGYDAVGNLTSQKRFNAAGQFYAQDSYGYDSLGNRITHTDAAGNTETYLYDGVGRVREHASFAGRKTRYAYRYIESIGGGLGGYEKITQTGMYGGSGELNRITDQSDYFGRARLHNDLGGHVFSYDYNQAGWLMRQTGNTALSESQSRHSAARNNQDIEYRYYANGYLKEVIDRGAGTKASYQYDKNGNRTLEAYYDLAHDADSASTDGYSDYLPYQVARIYYDELNRVKQVVDPSFDIKYGYDANGNRRFTDTKYLEYTDASGARPAKDPQTFFYLYDKEDRFNITMGRRRGSNGGYVIDQGNTGYAIQYYADGNRKSAESNLLDNNGVAAYSYERYDYGDLGTVDRVFLKTAPGGVESLRAKRVHNNVGHMQTYTEYDASFNVTSHHGYTYDKDGVVDKDTTYKDATDLTKKKSELDYNYLMDGKTIKNVIQTNYESDGTSMETQITTSYIYDDYDKWDSFKATEVRIGGTGSKDYLKVGWKEGRSVYTYDANGYNTYLLDGHTGRSIDYVTNYQGRVLRRQELNRDERVSENKSPYVRRFYFANNKVIGDVGNDPVPSRFDYAQALAQQDANKHNDIRERVTPTTSADFDQNYQPINPNYPGRSPSYYVVSEGDTLQSVALSVWGDSSLWYILADVNGLNGSEKLVAGFNLKVPNVVTNIHNNSETFRPYDPGLALGDTSPTLPDPPPPPPPKKKCGFKAFLVIVIAVAIAVLVTPAAIQGIGSLIGATVAESGAAAVAGGFVANGLGYTAVAAGGFAGGFLSSAASQLAAKEFGLQEHFSLRGAVRSGLTGAATAGANSYVKVNGWDQWAQNAATAGAAVGSNYLAGKATNLPTTFRWRDVATSFAAASVMSGIGVGDENAFYNKGLQGYVDGLLPSSIKNSSIARDVVQGLTAGAVSEAVRVAVYDSEDYRPDYVGMIAGVVGSTLGGLALSGVAKESQQSSAATVSATEKSYSDDYLYKYGIASLDGEGPVGPAYELNYLQERDETDSLLGEFQKDVDSGVELLISDALLKLDFSQTLFPEESSMMSRISELFSGITLDSVKEAIFPNITALGERGVEGSYWDGAIGVGKTHYNNMASMFNMLVKSSPLEFYNIGAKALGYEAPFQVDELYINDQELLGAASYEGISTIGGLFSLEKVGARVSARVNSVLARKLEGIGGGADSTFMRGKHVGTIDKSFIAIPYDKQVEASFSRIEEAFGSEYALKTRELFDSVRHKNFNSPGDMGYFSLTGKSPSISLNKQFGNSDIMALTILHEVRHLRQFNKVLKSLNLPVPTSTYEKVFNHYRARSAWERTFTLQEKEVFATSTNIWQANKLGLNEADKKIFVDYFNYWRGL
ncbi:LysM peptidoglycan-binding domain-containing protein [Hahella aquimaris]|uniref:LysM peptidoglycan-binding domain-containing protein n=1 Tax=Hahella sp. HNIBRBA332 TaxID=3015983 RepID=UPI00273ADBD3|nr:LysM peptidoglycan-binding domain-containing protein [Hahella sp. HNIBRBA332]WLQ12086.1 LysM peptidoglycan-binding domain-containing protein [Hahella sp. HNIBRBA332]